MRPVDMLTAQLSVLTIECSISSVYAELLKELRSELADEIGIRNVLLPKIAKLLPTLKGHELFACFIALAALHHEENSCRYIQPMIDLIFAIASHVYDETFQPRLYESLLGHIDWLETAKNMFKGGCTRAELINFSIDVIENKVSYTNSIPTSDPSEWHPQRVFHSKSMSSFDVVFVIGYHLSTFIQDPTDWIDDYNARARCPDITLQQLIWGSPFITFALFVNDPSKMHDMKTLMCNAPSFNGFLQLTSSKKILFNALRFKPASLYMQSSTKHATLRALIQSLAKF